MKYLLFNILLLGALISTGCTNENKNITGTPAVTIPQTPTLPIILTVSEKPSQENSDDRKFLEEVGICYNNTPVIKDTKTNLEFTICMQHTPIPTGICTQRFRSEILEYTTKDDSTTAGFNRETLNMQIARVRFSECLSRMS